MSYMGRKGAGKFIAGDEPFGCIAEIARKQGHNRSAPVFTSCGAAAFGSPAHLNLSAPPYLPTLLRLEAGALQTIWTIATLPRRGGRVVAVNEDLVVGRVELVGDPPIWVVRRP
jgi:hypothetical protein